MNTDSKNVLNFNHQGCFVNMVAVMHCFKKAFSILALSLIATSSQAATFDAVETFSFNATITEAGVLCGEFVGSEVDCDENFGTYSGTQADTLVSGMSVGDTYRGEVSLRLMGTSIVSATCALAGRDCNFGTDFLLFEPAPKGPVSVFSFLGNTFSNMTFDFSGISGTATLSTDYNFEPSGDLYYYAGTTWDLTDVTYELHPVPVPASVGFLLAGLGALGLLRRRRILPS